MAVKNVQGLRAVAALMVVFAHIGGATGLEAKVFGVNAFWVDLEEVGRTGVDLFFVISGFIMIVTTSKVAHGPGGARTFLWRRITRIYPPYLVLTAALFALYLLRPDLVNGSQPVRPDVVASFLLLPQEGLPLLLVGWTLVFEMYFYLVLALTLLLPKVAFVPVLVLWALLTIGAGLLPQGNLYVALISSPLNLEFLFGVVIGMLFVDKRLAAPMLFAVFGGVAVAAIALGVLLGYEPYQGNTWVQVLTVGIACTVLLYGMIGLEARNTFVVHPGLVGLGNSSYSLYLTHVGVFKILSAMLVYVGVSGLPMQILSFAVAVAGAIVGGLLYYAFVEKPLLRRLHGRRAVADKVGSDPAVASTSL